MTRVLTAVLLSATLFIVPIEASAKGPIIITGPIDCLHKMVQKCRWVGKRKICTWVESSECETL